MLLQTSLTTEFFLVKSYGEVTNKTFPQERFQWLKKIRKFNFLTLLFVNNSQNSKGIPVEPKINPSTRQNIQVTGP